MSARITATLLNPMTDARETRTYWVCARGSPSGYVYDVTDAPGTTGKQVSDSLSHYGTMLMCADTEDALRRTIKAAQSKRLRQYRAATR